jgi:hypothetical protein
MSIPETGLISWYPGDEASGNLIDAWGNNDGVAQANPGSAGGMRALNGATQFFTLPSNFGLGGVGQAMTIYCRVWFNGLAGHQVIIGAQNAGSTQICQMDLFGGAIRMAYGTGGFDVIATAANIAINTVYGIGFTLTAGGVGTIYRNGVAGNTDAARTGSFSGIPAFWVGTLNINGAPSSPHNGRIGSLGIWNVALTSDQMASLHSDPTFASLIGENKTSIGIGIGI